jgi:hypothetical protein
MSNRLIKYGFTAGIVSKDLWSQTILQKYGFGLGYASNYLIRFSGSAVSRPALIFGTLMEDYTEPFQFTPFTFARDDANCFSILVTAGKIRFLQNGVYQLEAVVAATEVASTVTETVISATAHGFAINDLIELYGANVPTALVGQTVIVSAVTTNTFTVHMIGAAISLDNWTAITAFSCRRVYTITNTYTEAQIPELYFRQTRDVIEITHREKRPAQLERQADGTWTLTEDTYEISVAAPTGLTTQAVSASGTSGTIFTVTAVNADGEESLPSNYFIYDTIVDYSTTAGYVAIQWNQAPDAVSYNVYRSTIAANSITLSLAFDVGYLGQAFAPQFTDKNIIPDFTKVPPTERNPFANSYIKEVEISTPGTGYAQTDTITVTDGGGTGSGAEIVPIVTNSGAIIGVLIKNAGQNYTTPIFTVTTSDGSGVVFTITLGPASGNYPAVSSTHLQRRVFASTANEPLGIWGSQIGRFDNFSFSRVIAADESYNYNIASDILGNILHLISTRAGLLTFTDIGVWALNGSNGAITPSDIQADLQTAVGSSKLIPLPVDSDILYAETDTQTVRLLQYNDFSKNFGGIDVSILSRELINRPYALTSWSYESRPYKIIWATRSDGQLLSLTVSQEQQVYAWSTHETAGLFLANHTLMQSEREITYFVTQRYMSGRWVGVIEYFADRELSTNFSHIGVDSAIGFGLTTRDAVLQLSATVDGTAVITASSAIFVSGDLDSLIVHDNGKAYITEVVSSTVVNVTIIDEFTHLNIPYLSTKRPMLADSWYISPLVTSQQLPLNMRPEIVTVAADAKVFENVSVAADGTVEFNEELSLGYIGFNFVCYLDTLPYTADGTIIEDSRVNTKTVGIRFVNSRGIEVGAFDDDYDDEVELFPVTDFFSDFMAEGTRLQSRHDNVAVSSDWSVNSRIRVQANGGNPTEITGMVFEVEVGDEV